MKNPFLLILLIVSCLMTPFVRTQPRVVDVLVRFAFTDTAAGSVSLLGDFNAWSKDESRMNAEGGGRWSFSKKLEPGIYQYMFLVDGKKYENDPGNPAMIDNYNMSGKNSVFVLTASHEVRRASPPVSPRVSPPVSPRVSPPVSPHECSVARCRHRAAFRVRTQAGIRIIDALPGLSKTILLDFAFCLRCPRQPSSVPFPTWPSAGKRRRRRGRPGGLRR